MPGYFGGGGRRRYDVEARPTATIERVMNVGLCEEQRCTDLAAWRLGYDAETVDLCPRHAVSTMRNRKVWSGRI